MKDMWDRAVKSGLVKRHGEYFSFTAKGKRFLLETYPKAKTFPMALELHDAKLLRKKRRRQKNG